MTKHLNISGKFGSRMRLVLIPALMLSSVVLGCLPPPDHDPNKRKNAASSEKDPKSIDQKTVETGPAPTPPSTTLPSSETVIVTPGAPTPTNPPPVEGCKIPFAAGVSTVKLQVAGMERQFRLFVPKKYDGKTYLPLVLNFHGSSNEPNEFAKGSGMEVVAEREGFIVAGIAGVNREWNVPPVAGKPDEVLNAKATIDHLVKTLCVDAKRVYATGFSGGGRTSSLLGCKMPEKLAAIAPVAGVRWAGSCVGRALPVFAIHGLKDTTNSYKGDGVPRWNESVESAVQSWAENNACNKTRIEDALNGTLQVYHYKDCKDGATVKLLRMTDQGHTYPTSKPINTADQVWGFLRNFKSP